MGEGHEIVRAPSPNLSGTTPISSPPAQPGARGACADARKGRGPRRGCEGKPACTTMLALTSAPLPIRRSAAAGWLKAVAKNSGVIPCAKRQGMAACAREPRKGLRMLVDERAWRRWWQGVSWWRWGKGMAVGARLWGVP